MRRYAHFDQFAGLLMHQVVHNPGRNAIYRCFLGNTVLSQFIERSNSKTQLAEINCSIGFIFRRKQIIAAIRVLHAKVELASMEWTPIDFHGTHNCIGFTRCFVCIGSRSIFAIRKCKASAKTHAQKSKNHCQYQLHPLHFPHSNLSYGLADKAFMRWSSPIGETMLYSLSHEMA